MDDTDFYILFIIGIILSIVIIIYFKLHNCKVDNSINIKYKSINNDIDNQELNEILLADVDTTNINNYGFINDLIKKNNSISNNNEDLNKYFTMHNDIPNYNKQYIGFCPKSRETGKQLPMANININCL